MTMDIACSRCGLCVRECSVLREAIELTETGVRLDVDRCFACGHCMAVCPTDEMQNPRSPRQELAGEPPAPDEVARYLRSVRSVRFFKPEAAPRAQMEALLDIGRYPQTGGNRQGVSYLVLEGRDKVEALAEVYCDTALALPEEDPLRGRVAPLAQRQRQGGRDVLFLGAPGLIIALADAELAQGAANAQYSLTFMSLLAPALGLGTCWAGLFQRLATSDEHAAPLWKHLGVPEGKGIRGVMMVGLPGVQFRRLVKRDPLEVDWR